jgi:hypothetical protein
MGNSYHYTLYKYVTGWISQVKRALYYFLRITASADYFSQYI